MRVYRLLLHLYPAWFRAEYSEEMCAVFAERRRNENAFGLWPAAIAELIASALAVQASVAGQDLRWTVRTLRQSPGFTGTALLVIALGIGATTTAFTLLDHVLLRPLPFPHQEELVSLAQANLANGGARTGASPPNFLDWRAMNTTFRSMGAYTGILTDANLSGRGEPVRVQAATISAEVLPTIGVLPAAGRNFTAEDEAPGLLPTVMILSDGIARSLFGSPAGAVGQTVRLNTLPITVVGVMPPGFAFPWRDADLWIPLKSWDNRTNQMLGGIARLRPGVTLAQARADLDRIARQLQQAYPKENKDAGISAVATRDDISAQPRMLVVAVFAAAFCLLLIACTNLANLLFARAMARRQEIAVRTAIGAARERLLRQLFTENLVLALVGGALGTPLAVLATPLLEVLVPSGLPIAATPEINWRIFAFAMALTFATSVGFGVAPAVRSTRTLDLNALRSRTAGGGRNRLRSVLVLAEVAGSVTLLIGSGLLLKSMWQVQAVNPGFESQGVLTLRTAIPFAMPAERRHEFYERVLSEVRALPGVTSAGYVSFLPMTAVFGNFPVTVPGRAESEVTRAHTRFVTPDYFATLRIPLLRGRDVSARDSATAPPVAIVSQSLAQRLWPGEDPIGRQINHGTVIGVVGDVAVRGLETSSLPQVYLSWDQIPPALAFYSPKDLVMRTATGDPMRLAPLARGIIRAADPEQAISGVQLLAGIVDSQTASRRAQLRALGVFAGIAFLLAAVGIHGLLSFAVSSRTQEVGVRMALGAQRGSILGMFLRQGVVLGLAGILIALPLAYFAARGMTALLFGVEPGDPWIYAAAATLALAMTVAGSLRPALRAAGIDPAITIRSE